MKFDFRSDRKDLYAPSSRDFSIVDVPSFSFLMIDGHGNPNTAVSYREAVEALYSLSYAAKFASKLELDRDYVVGPLEGLWWAESRQAFTARAKDDWSWTMMIRQPDWLTAELWDAARTKVAKKKLGALDLVRLESLHEGLSVQILYLGSYDDEAPTIARMHDEFIPANGLVETTDHHEIYLSDPRRVAPEKLKTVLRQPVRRVG